MNDEWILQLAKKGSLYLKTMDVSASEAQKILDRMGVSYAVLDDCINLTHPIHYLNRKQLSDVNSSIRVLTSCQSTQSLQHFTKNISVVLTEFQYKGKGRRGHEWEAPFGQNFTGSMRFHAHELSLRSEQLLIGVSAAVCDVLRELIPNKPIGIKWPNDVWVENRKIAGTLAEQHDDAWLIGLGINLHTPSHQLKKGWTSLFNETQEYCDRSDVSLRIIEAVQKNLCQRLWFDLNIESDYDMIRGKRLSTIDCPIISGISAGIQEDGSLLVVDDMNQKHRLTYQKIQIES